MCLTEDQWKRKKTVVIIKNEAIAKDVYEMDLQVGETAKEIEPGQFIHLYCRQGQRLLPRPISICEVDEKKGRLKIVYGIVGSGTKEFASYSPFETIDIIAPLGKGYQWESQEKHSILVGGGLGVPPLLELAKRLPGKVEVYLGFRSQPFLVENFKKYTDFVYIATDDGSHGTKGTVLDVLKNKSECPEKARVYTCGPKPMLQSITQWAVEKGYPIQVSLEERMACGVGACVGCVCKIKDLQTGEWQYQRVCKEGPVFNGKEVIWNEES
ncbi:MAG: dihydroorotate dehydrogenase electron transfer subunit [Epulopiscium sp.]|nr:dihydroorotate dehydrogenase electron transfer subunit [Candidatus Epulonipiscium sp.]